MFLHFSALKYFDKPMFARDEYWHRIKSQTDGKKKKQSHVVLNII